MPIEDDRPRGPAIGQVVTIRRPTILTQRVRELSAELVQELKRSMKEAKPRRAQAEAQMSRLFADCWNEAEVAARAYCLRDDLE